MVCKGRRGRGGPRNRIPRSRFGLVWVQNVQLLYKGSFVPRFLAVDWDQNQLHVVSGLAGGGKVRFQRAVRWQMDKSPNPAEAEALGRLLRDRLKEAGVAAAPVLACVGRDRVILKDLRFPAVPVSEEAGVVRFQAVKELTDSPDDVVIDYVTAGAPAGSEQQAQALIVRREILNTYQKICHAAGLKLAALTPRPFGIAASLRKATTAAEDAEGADAVVVIGEGWAEFAVLRGRTPLLSRTMAVGPGLAGEIRRNLTVYAGQAGRPPVRAVYVSGAGAELRERLGDMIEIPLHEFDPFAGAVGLDVPAGSRGGFAGAAGLLFARAEARGLPINFVHPRQPKPPSNPNNRRVVLFAAAAAVVILGLIACCWLVVSTRTRNLSQIQQQRDGLEAQLQEDRKEGKLYKALDDWDNVDWLDELYDLTDRIPDVNALRVSQVTAEPITRTAKAEYTARITLKGTFVGNEGNTALNQLVAAFRQDGYYSPEAPKVTGNQFTLVVKVERRPPGDYDQHKLKPAPETAAPDFGADMGGVP